MKKYYKSQFSEMNNEQLNTWIVFHARTLIGSAVFTSNKSFASKIVRWAEGWGKKEKEKFVPSHTGSIILYNDKICVFDMKPPKAQITPLIDYMANTKDNYVLVLRDFKLNEKMFSINIAEHEKQWYPFMSAIRSVFTKRQTKWATHCSELTLREYQKQGIMTEYNPECTPDELYHWMVDKKN